MLLIESKISAQSVDGGTRLLLLEKLQEMGLTALIRSARRTAFELALGGSTDRVAELERAVASHAETEEGALYVRGDLFCFDGYTLYLIFGNEEDEVAGMRAGIIYENDAVEPLSRLDAFCRNVYQALEAARRSAGREEFIVSPELAVWKRDERERSAGWSRFVARHAGNEGLTDEAKPQENARPVELLANVEARRLLRRVIEAEGRVSELLSQQEDKETALSLVNRLAEVGLVQREVAVSCRQVGRALFRLPSPDTLAVITASNAVCSECGAAIADEKIEDVIAPTGRAAALLADGSWLSTQLRATLQGMGIAETSVVNGRTLTGGELHLMASVCREPFLFVVRDGDLLAAQTLHVLDELVETESNHLVVITTGKVQEEARVRLREHARRRAREGHEIEIIFIEGMDAVASELQHAFERVSQRALADELCELDGSLGLSIGHLVATRFRLAQTQPALTDLAASAVGALAGSLREI